MRPLRQEDRFDRETLRYSAVGVEFCTVVCVLSYAGHLLDLYFEYTDPWLLILGFLSGFGLMVYWLFKNTREMQQ